MSGVAVVTQETAGWFQRLVDGAADVYAHQDSPTARWSLERDVQAVIESGQFEAVAQYAGFQCHDYVRTVHGSWEAFCTQVEGLTAVDRAYRALAALDHTETPFGMCHQDRDKIAVLVALAGLAARASAQMALPLLLDTTPVVPKAPSVWHVNPKALPDWRRRMLAYTQSETGVLGLQAALGQGYFTLCPDPGRGEGDHETGIMDMAAPAAFLAAQEVQTLTHARLYVMDDDMMALALRKAMRSKKAPVSADRMLPGAGLVVFPTPIDMVTDAAPESRPIYAVSWNRWDATAWSGGRWILTRNDHIASEAGQPPYASVPAAEFHRNHPTAWWFTLYTHSSLPGSPPLSWETEMVVSDGAVFGYEPVAGTNEIPVRATIAMQELITQTELLGKTITHTREHVRKPTKVRADRRAGVSDDGRVRVVTVGGNGTGHLPRPRAAGSKRGPMQHRTWVREHDRQQCPNPHRHAELGDACVHHEITILEHVRGPADAPFRLPDTVHHVKGPA